ncbi:MAG: Gldg family protein [Steroidobacteraceae bacterium]
MSVASTRKALGGGAIAALALLFVALTVLSGLLLRGARLDLTENRLYTLSPGTLNIVRSLPEPVTLTLFYSAQGATDLPQIRTYAMRVRELLEELASRSNGKLRLNVIDPQPFSEDEDRASELGIRSVPLGGAGGQLWLGLAGSNSTDGKAVIPFLDPAKEPFLEYDIAKLIQQLGAARKPVVGWLTELPMQGGFDPMTGQPSDPWLVLSQAQELFDVRLLEPTLTQLDPAIEVLVLVHPKTLTPAARFAIDQFALRGGRILLFVDPLAEGDNSAAEPGNPLAAFGAERASRLDDLLAAWGVQFDRGNAVGDLNYGITVSMQPGAPPTRHIGILGLDRTALSADDVTTATLDSINLASSGFVAPAEGAGTRFEPLLQTSVDAAPIPAQRFEMLMDPGTLRDGFKSGGQRLALAARVTGKVRSAFASGPPAGAVLPEGATALVESAQPLNLIVVADTDLLSDFLWVRQQNFFGQRVAQAWANNGDFVWNAIDNLAGSGDLISLRGRASFALPVRAGRRVTPRRPTTTSARRRSSWSGSWKARADADTAAVTRAASRRGCWSPEQQAEIERFEGQKLRIRRELREVRRGLDEEIEALGDRLKLLNIVVAPLLFAGVAMLMAWWRRRRQAAIVTLQRDRNLAATGTTPPDLQA